MVDLFQRAVAILVEKPSIGHDISCFARRAMLFLPSKRVFRDPSEWIKLASFKNSQNSKHQQFAPAAMNKPAPPAPKNDSSDPSWIERNVNMIIIGLIVACVLSVLAHYFPGLDHEHHHPHFEQEGWPGFQAAFGFITFVVIVFLGRGLRLIVQRKESYYDRD